MPDIIASDIKLNFKYARATGAKIYVYANELRKFWHFYIIKVLFLSIWMGRNNHLH